MPFRLEHITLAERVDLGCLCLLGAGQYGLITALAGELGTSRQFLYTLRARAHQALERALAPGQPGRPARDQRLVVDELAVQRAILVLSQVAQASVREIQEVCWLVCSSAPASSPHGGLSAKKRRGRAT